MSAIEERRERERGHNKEALRGLQKGQHVVSAFMERNENLVPETTVCEQCHDMQRSFWDPHVPNYRLEQAHWCRAPQGLS